MKRNPDPDMQFDNKSIGDGIEARHQCRADRPQSQIALFPEHDIDGRCRELVVLFRETRRLPEVRAAEDCETIHAIGREMKTQARLIDESRLSIKSTGVGIALDDLTE